MWPSQITFGPVVLHLYGLIIGVAIWAAAQVAATVYKRQGGKEKVIWQGFLWLLVGGVIGARWYHVIDGWEYYQANPGAIFQIWQGGVGVWGAIIGGLGGILVYSWVKRLAFLTLADAVVMGAPLGQAIGRWGNYVNQELYGQLTKLPWGITITGLLGKYQPLFLYESGLCLGLFGLLLFLEKRQRWPLGWGGYLGVYLVGYGLIRLMLEPFRLEPWRVGGVPTASLVAGLMLIVGLLYWVRAVRIKAHA